MAWHTTPEETPTLTQSCTPLHDSMLRGLSVRREVRAAPIAWRGASRSRRRRGARNAARRSLSNSSRTSSSASTPRRAISCIEIPEPVATDSRRSFSERGTLNDSITRPSTSAPSSVICVSRPAWSPEVTVGERAEHPVPGHHPALLGFTLDDLSLQHWQRAGGSAPSGSQPARPAAPFEAVSMRRSVLLLSNLGPTGGTSPPASPQVKPGRTVLPADLQASYDAAMAVIRLGPSATCGVHPARRASTTWCRRSRTRRRG